MDLDTAIMEAKKAIHCFFNNDFEEARKILEPWADSSMYHSLGTSVFAFLEAILTFEQVLVIKSYLPFVPLQFIILCYIFSSSVFILVDLDLYRISFFNDVLYAICRSTSRRHRSC